MGEQIRKSNEADELEIVLAKELTEEEAQDVTVGIAFVPHTTNYFQ